MKKKFIILTIGTLVLLSYFKFFSPYQRTNDKIGIFTVYQKHQGFCDAFFTVSLYEDEQFTYYTNYSGCQQDDYLYIFNGFRFISLKDGLNRGIINPEAIKGLYIEKSN